MFDTTSHNSETSTETTIIDILNGHYPDHEPVVRYAFPRDDDGPEQEPILRNIHASIPEEANWASAIYLASDSQLERLDEHASNPYGNPSTHNIAKTIQDECEDIGRVLYSVHAESDEYEDDDDDDVVLLSTMIDWLQRFVRRVIDIDPTDCTFYYSGNRSIHAHAPLLVTGDNLKWLKDQTKQFCDGTEIVLDASVYKQKQQFRLPGAVHQDNGRAFQKVEIETDWERREIISAATDDVVQPDTYADVLTSIFNLQEPTDLSDLFLSSATTDTESPSESSSVLSTWPSRYLRPDNEQKRAYEAPEFYPYPTGDNHAGRSVAAIRVVDEPFQRRAAGRLRTFIPCFFYGAHSCSGQEYTKDQHYAPLQLSKADAQKWDYEEGENLVVIGGGNYQSIIHKVGEGTAKSVGNLLDPDSGDRDDALDHLQDEGYDVGSAGRSQSTSTTTDQQSKDLSEDDACADEQTDALRYKERAEQGSVEMSLEHEDRRDVANRLLVIGGWDPAWNWFREQYGADFDPQRTWQEFRSIIQTHSDHDEDLATINIPPQP